MLRSARPVMGKIKEYFEKHPEVSYKEFEQEVYDVFKQVQAETIKPYQSIGIKMVNRDFNSYKASEHHVEEENINDESLMPKKGGRSLG